jgi:hypothetical protein
MSHYSLLVVGENIKKQLEPFEESPKKKKYIQFKVEAPKKKFRQNAITIIKSLEGRDEVLKEKYEKLFKNKNYTRIFRSWYGGFKNKKGDWGYTHNPNAKWDWYEVGGRWQGLLILKGSGVLSDSLTKKDIDFEEMKRQDKLTIFAVLKNGEWFEHGKMGWWGCVREEKEAKVWTEELSKLLDSIDDNELITIVDCHI